MPSLPRGKLKKIAETKTNLKNSLSSCISAWCSTGERTGPWRGSLWGLGKEPVPEGLGSGPLACTEGHVSNTVCDARWADGMYHARADGAQRGGCLPARQSGSPCLSPGAALTQPACPCLTQTDRRLCPDTFSLSQQHWHLPGEGDTGSPKMLGCRGSHCSLAVVPPFGTCEFEATAWPARMV